MDIEMRVRALQSISIYHKQTVMSHLPGWTQRWQTWQTSSGLTAFSREGRWVYQLPSDSS